MTTVSDRSAAPTLSMASAPSIDALSGGRFLPLLVLLFVGSGCAALIYEIVWLQLLQLVIGASAISLGVLLGTFMGGMCLGSLLLSKCVSRSRHPLRVYAVLELLIGACGLLVLTAVPTLAGLYGHLASPGAAAILLRGVMAGVCLLPPTLLMGATLPAIARYVEASPRGVSWLGFFYGGNIVGAVFGCLLAGFYLLRLYDMPTATFVALGINIAVALLALSLSFVSPHCTSEAVTVSSAAEPAAAAGEQSSAMLIYAVTALSGFTALGAEVIWTRLLSLMLGATVYTFSIILAVFLLGLGIGSTVGAALARSSRRPRTALAVCQFLLAVGICWAAFAIAKSLPFWPFDPSMSISPWIMFQTDIARALWAVLPPAILWGASFPLALAAVPARKNADPGALVGRVYAANTVGAIFGSLAFSMLVVPAIGTLHGQQLLAAAALVSAVIAIAPSLVLNTDPGRAVAYAMASLLLVAGAGWLIVQLTVTPWIAVAFGRNSATWLHEGSPPVIDDDDMHLIFAQQYLHLNLTERDGEVAVSPPDQAAATPGAVRWVHDHRAQLASALDKQAHGHQLPSLANSYYDDPGERPDRFCTFVGEGMNVSVAVTYMPDLSDPENPHLYRYFHGAGKVQASSDHADMRLQRSLGHISALVHGNPENVLVVACGAGVTAGSFVPYDSVKRIVICDIEPMVPAHVAPLFANENYSVVSDPRTQVVLDDGRHFVRTTKEKFDIITSDPIDPWVKGCAALNTVEYYEMCKEHLKPGGVMALWIPLYENSEESAKSIIATFFKVFPNGILWSNDVTKGQGYDAVLFGTVEPTTIDVDKMQAFLDSHPKVKKSLTDVGFGAPEGSAASDSSSTVAIDLLSSFAADAHHLTAWTYNAQINEDRNLRLQYLAGMALNQQIAPEILNHIMAHYQFPTDIFHGKPETLQALAAELRDKGRIPHFDSPQD